MLNKWKAGDVVQLKSGGRSWTVVEVVDSRTVRVATISNGGAASELTAHHHAFIGAKPNPYEAP